MTHALVLLLALLIGVIAGLRSLAAPAAVSWAALLNWINLDDTWASWMAHPVTVGVVTAAAAVEFAMDKSPKAPSRKNPAAFAARLIAGGFAGAVLGTAWGYTWGSLGAGIVGAVLGTLGGYTARTRLVAARGGRDAPIALLEDAVTVGGAVLIVYLASIV
jgi:uncharacterized membrane protein